VLLLLQLLGLLVRLLLLLGTGVVLLLELQRSRVLEGEKRERMDKASLPGSSEWHTYRAVVLVVRRTGLRLHLLGQTEAHVGAQWTLQLTTHLRKEAGKIRLVNEATNNH